MMVAPKHPVIYHHPPQKKYGPFLAPFRGAAQQSNLQFFVAWLSHSIVENG